VIAPGTRFGPYEVIAPIGAGGMGEVYRARDTRLNREVAIKVLPQHLAATPEVRARFEREARTASSLNHPNICVLYDIGREGETDYLVMELLDGETLGARLERGPLPAADLLRIGTQIADALDRAHRQGLVHRDLKPSNVMLTKSGAKLLDFGLARVTGLSSQTSELSTSPTVTRALTAEGSIVGTFQYMSPEVLEGHEADARSDLWALGAMLFEMATGKRPFEGKSQASLIGAIMNTEPPAIGTLVPLAPPALERVVRACLAKDPDQRIQTAHDVKLQLQWIAEGGSQAGVPAPIAARRRDRERMAWWIAGVAGLIAVGLGVMLWRGAAQPPHELRFDVGLPPSLSTLGPLTVSPDGLAAAFAASDTTGTAQLWLRTFDNPECRPLPGTQGATRPCWSPDSRSLAFFADNKLKKILISGGRPETVCEAPGGSDCSWGVGDVILFDGDGAHPTVRMVSAAGGEPHIAAAPDSSRHELAMNWPAFLPDGKHFLFIAQHNQSDESEVRLGALGSKQSLPVLRGESRVEYAPPGYLLFEREGALMAQKLDVGSGKLQGEPHTLVDRIGVNRGNGMPYFSSSKNGVLIFSQASNSLRHVEWVDRTGRTLEEVGSPGSHTNIALSPDGRMLATELNDASGQAVDLWVRDLTRGIASRFTTDPANDIWPMWSADSKRLYWTSNRRGKYSIFERDIEGVASDSLFYTGANNIGPSDASRDGNWIACMESDGSGNWDVLALPTHGAIKPVVIANSHFSEQRVRFSPDSRWVAYDSDQSGRNEVYVQAFPTPSAPVQISNQGGGDARWSADGKELYYRNSQQVIMAVDVKLGDRFEAGAPRQLFASPLLAQGLQVSRYIPSADGQKFLFSAPMHAEIASPTIVFNWNAELKK
jgi:eukaryotic-like serine/threonine-protein kinase